ncbi:MAG: GNAT family N-acetyltransferase [Cyclobacteriaceae bacterium]
MIIRKAELGDLRSLAVLFDEYRVFYKKDSDILSAQSFLKERIEKNESEIFVSFNEEGIMTGFTQLYPLFSSTRMQRFWLLNDLYVNGNYRRQGFSVGLIERAKALCRESGACGMMLETAKTNVEGNKLYPKTGFELDSDHNYYEWSV